MDNRSSETTTIKLLDAWKAKKGVPSDNAAALALGVKRQSVSKWRNGQSHASAGLAARMARDLGMKEIDVLAAIEADRATDREDQKVWARYGKGAFMALLVGVAVGMSPTARADLLLEQLGTKGQQVSKIETEPSIMRNKIWACPETPQAPLVACRAVRGL